MWIGLRVRQGLLRLHGAGAETEAASSWRDPDVGRARRVAKGSRELADMEARIDKTETMFPRDDACGWEVTFNEYEEVEWNHTCEYCGRGFDTKGAYGSTLVHTAR